MPPALVVPMSLCGITLNVDTSFDALVLCTCAPSRALAPGLCRARSLSLSHSRSRALNNLLWICHALSLSLPLSNERDRVGSHPRVLSSAMCFSHGVTVHSWLSSRNRLPLFSLALCSLNCRSLVALSSLSSRPLFARLSPSSRSRTLASLSQLLCRCPEDPP